MSELAVYYCQNCGYYGYYQLSRNAICPKCDVKMTALAMHYQDFMDLGCQERDELLSWQIIDSGSSIVQRLAAPHKAANSREMIAHMSRQIEELEIENKKLNDTVSWMHQTIWDLLRKNKE